MHFVIKLFMLLPFQGVELSLYTPRAMPWAMWCWAFSPKYA